MSNNPLHDRLLVSVAETGRVLRISVRTVHRMLAAKQLDAVKCRGATRVTVESIHAFIARSGAAK